MKKDLLSSYIGGITDSIHGERYRTIFNLMAPELVTAFLIYSMPIWIDAFFVSTLKSTPMYATLGATNNFLHFFVKIAEAFGVGTIVLSGQFNGVGDFKEAGRSLRDAFWITCILGFAIASMLYFGAYGIYYWYGVSDEMIVLGIPFLRMRALSIFFMFIYFAFVGFLRGIKNTKTPMQIFVVGVFAFIFFDYVLIFGKFGFPDMGLQGSAVASVLQYIIMLLLAAIYVLHAKKSNRYDINLLAPLTDGKLAIRLLWLSAPIVCDKAILAFAYIWLCKMLSSMGTNGLATFCAIKDMERFAFLPAIAAAQVITLLVSNDYGRKNWEGIKSNIKKVTFLASILVFVILLVFSLWPAFFIQIFDQKGDFTGFAAQIFPILSGLVFFDLIQIVLAGALRGAGETKMVMLVRLFICLGYFIPVSYLLAQLPIENQIFKFVLIFGAYYVGNLLMSIIYINRFRGEKWKGAVNLIKGIHDKNFAGRSA